MMQKPSYRQAMLRSLVWGVLLATCATNAWILPPTPTITSRPACARHMSAAVAADYQVPEDAVITIKPNAMHRLQELRKQQKLAEEEPLVLRMGVRSGGCSGMSYVMVS